MSQMMDSTETGDRAVHFQAKIEIIIRFFTVYKLEPFFLIFENPYSVN